MEKIVLLVRIKKQFRRSLSQALINAKKKYLHYSVRDVEYNSGA